MKKFKDYINFREELSDDGPQNPFQDQETMDLVKIVFERYPEEIKTFLEGLSGQQDDHDLKELLKKIGGHGQNISIHNHKRKDNRPEVMPPESDSPISDTDN
jgi:hypothetical protein